MPILRKVNGSSKGGGGVQNPNFCERKYDNEMEFLGVGVGGSKKPSVGGVWIFSETTQCPLHARTLPSPSIYDPKNLLNLINLLFRGGPKMHLK